MIAKGNRSGQKIDIEIIQTIVETSDKKRFALSDNGKQIRAVQGHSTANVTISREAIRPPEFLYHGTATRFLNPIRVEGLRAGQRHQVHLSGDTTTARDVGRRHGQPVIFIIAARRMHDDGFEFFQAENGVWLTDQVPVDYLSESSAEGWQA